jgi:hypothetical protein
MEQSELIRLIAENPTHFAWLLGAGASQSANLPTAWDLIWELKRREYNLKENQKVPKSDIQNRAIQEKIQDYFTGRGFPSSGDPAEYSRYFELIFGDDMERQRKWLHGMLDEGKVALAMGHRVLAALMSSGRTKVVFTTNFDTVIEKAVAEVGGRSVSAFHLEGSYAVNSALNSEEYPVYCKLHGDFRYESLKNLADDLLTQNEELGKGLVTAANRFGFVVSGYSGRDDSVIELLRKVLQSHNPFPHGLYWTKLKGSIPLRAVVQLIEDAKAKGVRADFVDIETFDALMSRVWRQLDIDDQKLDAKVRRAVQRQVNIPLPKSGTGNPVLRSNAIRIEVMPHECLQLFFKSEQDWDDLKAAQREADNEIICTMGTGVFAWGRRASLGAAFGAELASVEVFNITPVLEDIDAQTYFKGFVEEAICRALIRGKPLLLRRWRSGWALIVDRHSTVPFVLTDLARSVGGALVGNVPGKLTKVSDDHPKAEQISWAEAIQVDLEVRNGEFFLLLRPDVWVWPRHGREEVTAFLDMRRGGRYNSKADVILTEWIKILLPESDGHQSQLTYLGSGAADENPSFQFNTNVALTARGNA